MHEFKVNRKKSFSLLIITALLLSSLVVLVKIPTVQAATIFEDGFETGDFSLWDAQSLNPEITTDTVHHGSYAAVFNATGEYLNTTFAAENLIYASWYINVDGLSASDGHYEHWFRSYKEGGYTEVAAGISNVGGQYFLRFSGDWGTNQTYQVGDISESWYCMTIKIDASNDQAVLYWDDDVIYTETYSASGCTGFRLGSQYRYGGGDWNTIIDCVRVDDADYIGVEEEEVPSENSVLAIKGKWVNSSIPNDGFEISVLAMSNTTLANYTIGDDSTGEFVNGTNTDFAENQYSAMARKTGTLPANGTELTWQAWVWDDAGNVTTTGLQTMKVYSISLTSVSVTTINAANDACNANGGGSIVLPAGNFTMDLIDEGTWISVRYRGVTIDGGVNLFGAGDNQTILYTPTSAWRSGGNTSAYDEATYADQQFYLDGTNGKGIRISGILFQGSVNFSSARITYYGSDPLSYDGGLLLGILEHGVTDFRIDHCTFLDFSNAAIFFETKMVTPSLELEGNSGVVDHCIIDNPYKNIYWNETGYYPLWGYGMLVNGAGWVNNGWRTYDELFGQYGAEIPIIEDVSFARCRHTIAASGQGSDAYYVVRHSNMTDNIRESYASFIDVHPGARGFEAYENIFTDVPNDYRSGDSSYGQYLNRMTTSDSGSGLVFNNTVNYCASGVNIRTAQTSNETWRTNGWWIWDNTYNDVASELLVDDDAAPFDIVLEDEYFLHAPNSSQLGFDYYPLVYPLFNDQLFEEQEPVVNTYVTEISSVSPENTTVTSSTVGFEVSTVGSNETGITLQIQLYNESGAVYPENFTSATGTFTGLTNGTYTFAVYAVGAHGASDYKTVTFTVAIVEEPETTPAPSTPTGGGGGGVVGSYTVTVTVHNDSKVLANVEVRLGNYYATSDSDGKAVFVGLTGGFYELKVYVAGQVLYENSVTVQGDSGFMVDLSKPGQAPLDTDLVEVSGVGFEVPVWAVVGGFGFLLAVLAFSGRGGRRRRSR